MELIALLFLIVSAMIFSSYETALVLFCVVLVISGIVVTKGDV